MPIKESHPDDIGLLDQLVTTRLAWTGAAIGHARQCPVCAGAVEDLLRIGAAVFESEPGLEMSAESRARAMAAQR
jgi:hypothetical protein